MWSFFLFAILFHGEDLAYCVEFDWRKQFRWAHDYLLVSILYLLHFFELSPQLFVPPHLLFSLSLFTIECKQPLIFHTLFSKKHGQYNYAVFIMHSTSINSFHNLANIIYKSNPQNVAQRVVDHRRQEGNQNS